MGAQLLEALFFIIGERSTFVVELLHDCIALALDSSLIDTSTRNSVPCSAGLCERARTYERNQLDQSTRRSAVAAKYGAGRAALSDETAFLPCAPMSRLFQLFFNPFPDNHGYSAGYAVPKIRRYHKNRLIREVHQTGSTSKRVCTYSHLSLIHI